MDLTSASAIVTGGAGGFGSATVRRLVQRGAKVVIAHVSDERGAGQGGRLPLRVDRLHRRRRHPAAARPDPASLGFSSRIFTLSGVKQARYRSPIGL
jgi:NAD(P)-dependent dehydrogenase (short-subunit alcohol dehydrogenase family)